jgi:hypothetical protein
MRLREVDALLAAANPLPPARVDAFAVDARALSDRARVRAVAPSITPVAPSAGRRRPVRRLVLAALAAMLLAASVAGAWMVRDVFFDLGPQPPDFPALPTHGTFLGTLEGVSYFDAEGSGPGERCLVRTSADAGLVRRLTCGEFMSSGGIVVMDRRSSGYRQYGPYLVAGLVPKGITSALVAGRRVEVHDGFFAVALHHRPENYVVVSGPGAPAIARVLWPYERSTHSATGEAGPTYRVLVTPGGIVSKPRSAAPFGRSTKAAVDRPKGAGAQAPLR